MIDLQFNSTFSRDDNALFFTVLTTLIDLEFSLNRIFDKLERNAVPLCIWPETKIMEEIRRAFSIKHFRSENRHLVPFYYHIVVQLDEQAILVFYGECASKNKTDKPIFSFCYR